MREYFLTTINVLLYNADILYFIFYNFIGCVQNKLLLAKSFDTLIKFMYVCMYACMHACMHACC